MELSAVIEYLLLSVSCTPFLHHVMVGRGWPSAVQLRVMFLLRSTSTCSPECIKEAGTVATQHAWQKYLILKYN